MVDVIAQAAARECATPLISCPQFNAPSGLKWKVSGERNDQCVTENCQRDANGKGLENHDPPPETADT